MQAEVGDNPVRDVKSGITTCKERSEREKRCERWCGTPDRIEAVVTYIWIILVTPVLMKQIFSSWDCTRRRDDGVFVLDIDPQYTCPFNSITMIGVHSFLCFVILPLHVFLNHVVLGRTRPSYASHYCEEDNCEDCSRRRRFGFFFEKFREKDYLWEFVPLLRSIFIAAMGTFLTTRILIQMSLCIICNIIVLVAVLRRRPFLPAGTCKISRKVWQCGAILGINNTLEVLLLIAEIFLWCAGLGNAIFEEEDKRDRGF